MLLRLYSVKHISSDYKFLPSNINVVVAHFI